MLSGPIFWSRAHYHSTTNASKPTLVSTKHTLSEGCLIAYCGINGDPYRIINGYDKCGNICGRKNPRADANKFPCYGEDQTKKTLLLVTEAEKILFNYQNVNRECVAKCSTGYRKYLNRCVPEITSSTKNTVVSKTGIKDFFQEASEDINMSWKEILYLCIIAMTFCIVILILFRFLAGVMVWLVLVGVVIATIAGTIYLWITWKKKKDAFSGSKVNEEVNQRTVITYLVAAIIATIITVIVLLVILVMRKRIALVITLFKEAGKAIHNMPLLLFEPFLVTRWYNLFGLFWFTQFIMGCQHMVIAGAVSKWFFTRNKSSLDSPILKSFKNLVRYHLGTVAMGSLLIAMVQMVRVVLTFVQNRLKGYDNSVTKCLLKCCQCCLYLLEKFLMFFTRNAYIQTAIHGSSFCRSGKQAFSLLSANALRVAAINSVGDFVLFLGKAMVVISTVLIGIKMLDNMEGIHHVWVPLVLAGLFAFIVADCFVTVYEMAIDTIFLCFCEDCEANDGLNRPYFMSRGLMEFVQNSKKALGIVDSSSTSHSQAWSPVSQRVATVTK
ncbi:unnamed protein product [Timema podura]|uniref:Choline transporter-like protein n=1 Tax=Timema podura TaxID=61482 RepID=A0ABN7NWE5_TIMPD|nr:unnamed protein product [Timema podura]